MQYPERFSALLGYPFPRLRALLAGIPAGGEAVHMSLGEPRQPFPSWVSDELIRHENFFNSYPKNNGEDALIEAVSAYMQRRFDATGLTAKNITPLNGTREGLYMAALALFPEKKNGKLPKVLVPNPFYQVYMMGARTLGLEVEYVNAEAENGFLPDFAAMDRAALDQTVAVFVCSPSNPQGAIADEAYLHALLTLAQKHDFLVMADECYSELYYGAPPASAIGVAQKHGFDLNRVVAFHSLSKRSNLPGLRSGFAVSGEKTMAKFHQLRGYAGAPIPGPVQMVSAKLWADDQHADENRALYAEKMDDVADLFGKKSVPGGGFFLWLKVGAGEDFTKELWAKTGIEVLPGKYLGADTKSGNPGDDYIRIALVDLRERTKAALARIKEFTTTREEAL